MLPAALSTPSVLHGRQAEASANDQRVLNAARNVFARLGWAAPVSLVAKSAGVGVGSLYRRFGSKEELLQYLCQMSLEQMAHEGDVALASESGQEWNAFETFVSNCVALKVGAFGTIAEHLSASPSMAKAAEVAHTKVVELVMKTQSANALRPDVTAVDIHEMLEVFSQRNSHVPDAAAVALADGSSVPGSDRTLSIFLAGLRPAAALVPLPEPTSWLEYRARWTVDAPNQTWPDPPRRS
jgi:AcrR family transcriptional regulator